jgi:mannitol-1-phosphate 5-dehydrogenase
MKLVQFGAGNIGRSFVGQLFSQAGWEVVFVDIDERIIEELNRRRKYRVEIRDREPRTIEVEHVRGVPGGDVDRVSDEIAEADLAATAVGQKALPYIMKPLAEGLGKRVRHHPGRPLDIVICENMREGARFFREALEPLLPPEASLDETVGLVETSIGKMVPIMSEEDRAQDPLLVYAEAYNTLIVDRCGFLGEVPEVPGLRAVEHIEAYVDQKLFIHNMSHAVAGYTSFVFRPRFRYVWEAASDPAILRVTRQAMEESAGALLKEYSDVFDRGGLDAHCEDLLRRFQNRALGDTIYRVGRDLYRKLGPDDRLIGSINLCSSHGIVAKRIALAVACSLHFRGVDGEGRMYEPDRLFHEREMPRGVDHVLREVCRLSDERIISLIERYHESLAGGNRDLADPAFS